MATAIRIRSMKPPKEPGMVTMTVIVQSDDIPMFYIDVSIFEKGSPELNLEEARGLLQRFSHDFQEALQRPLQFED